MVDIGRIFRIVLAVIGLLLSAYAYKITTSDKEFTSMCDFIKQVSCSRMYRSIYARGFGFLVPIVGRNSWFNVPNGAVWIALYLLSIVWSLFLPTANRMRLLTYIYGLLCVSSLYFVYVMYRLKNVCLLTISLYIINCLLFFLGFKRFNEAMVLEKYKVE